jgi:hypothetical protein
MLIIVGPSFSLTTLPPSMPAGRQGGREIFGRDFFPNVRRKFLD